MGGTLAGIGQERAETVSRKVVQRRARHREEVGAGGRLMGSTAPQRSRGAAWGARRRWQSPQHQAPRGQADDGGDGPSASERGTQSYGMARRRGVTDGRTEERVMDEVRHQRRDRDQQQRRLQHAPGSGAAVQREEASLRRRIAL